MNAADTISGRIILERRAAPCESRAAEVVVLRREEPLEPDAMEVLRFALRFMGSTKQGSPPPRMSAQRAVMLYLLTSAAFVLCLY